MSDVNANINISINSSQALGQLRALQSQISAFNESVIAGNAAAAASQKSLTANLAAQVAATKGFTTSMVNVESSVSRLGTAIDKNKLSLGQYFRYGAAASGAFGKGMKEHAEIMELAGDRVKRLQTQYVALGQAQNGMQRAMAIRPLQLHNADAAIGIQRQQIFNKLMHDGSTSMVNWGKNTQWAGRQLMVGFTVPLTIFGGIAGKIFMDLEKQIVQFKRVYGDLNTTPTEKSGMVEQVKALGVEFTKYGIAVSDTVALAAKAAATGATGADLIAQTTEATRLATLGQIDYQQALDATISLQTAFNVTSKDLAGTTDFLNAVENQTVTSLDDITQAIPLVAPVIRGLGGDVKDLAIFLTAMREGGVNANEGANALKSGLASLINPTKAAREQLNKVGIDIKEILSTNKGDLRGLVMEFGAALGQLDKFERQQTLAKMFGKYQFARLGALFQNISKDGTQASRVIDLTGESAKNLAKIAEGELGQLEEAVGVKFTAAVEKLKLAIAPVGEAFLKIATPLINFATTVAEKFNELPDGMKTFITWGVAIGGVVIPAVVMLVGLFANFLGQMIKMGNAVRMMFSKTKGLGAALQYLSGEEIDAMAASASLEGQTNSLTGALNVQRGAVMGLAKAYGAYSAAAEAAAAALPQGFRGPAGRMPRKMATGGFVAGSGNKDSEPALLMPGEFVVNKKAAQQNSDILAAMNNGTLRGYSNGTPVNMYGEFQHRVQRGAENMGQVAVSVPSSSDVLAGMSVRAGEARGIPISEARVSAGAFDSIARELKPISDSFVSRISHHFNETFAGIQDEGQRMEKAWLQAGRDIEQDIEKLAVETDRAVARRVVGLDEDLYGTIPTAESVKGSGSLDKARKGAFTKKGFGGVSSYATSRRGILSMWSRLTGQSNQGMQIGHTFKPRVGDLDEILASPAVGTGARQAAKSLGRGVVDSSAAGAGTNSPSDITMQQGKDVAKGMEIGIEKGTPGAVAAAEKMGAEVAAASDPNATTASGRRRRGATRPAGPPDRYDNSGNKMVGGANNQTNSPKTKGQAAFLAASEGATQQFIGVKDEAEKTRRGLKGMGAKLGGSMFALDGLVFGLSFMENGIGDFAQKIMPAVFAIQGLTMMLPLLSNPIGLAVGAAVALGAGLFLLNKQTDDMRAKGKQLADAMYGTAQNMQDTAAFFGRKTWEDKLKSANIVDAGGDAPTAEVTQQAQSYLESDAGKTLFENVRATLDSLGSDKAAQALQNNLQRMMLSGAIAPEMGSAIASQIGDQLGNQQITFDAVSHMTEIIGPDGQNLKTSDGRLKITADIIGDASSLVGAFEQAGIVWDGSSWLAQVSMVVKGEGTADIFADTAAQESINKLTIYQNELDRIEARWKEGKLSAKQYQEQVAAVFSQKDLVSYQGMVAEAQKLYGEAFDDGPMDKMGQTLADSLMNSINSGLGETVGKEFLEGLTATIGSADVNLLDPERVREAVLELKSMGKNAEAAGLQKKYDAVMDLSLQISSGAVSVEDVQRLLDNDVDPADIAVKLGVTYDDPQAEAIYSMALGTLAPDDILFNAVVNYLDNGMTDAASELVNMSLRGDKVGINFDLEFNTFGSSVQEVDALIGKVEHWDRMAAKKNPSINRMVKFASENFGMVKSQIDGWAKLSDVEKKSRMMIWVDAYLKLRQDFVDSGALEDTMAQLGSAVTKASGGREGLTNSYATAGANYQASNTESSSSTLDPKGSGGGGGGGGDKEDPLKGYKDMWAGLKETLKMYTNIENVLKKLKGKKDILAKALKDSSLGFNHGLVDEMRRAGLSESFIADLASKGYKEAKKIFETLKKRDKLALANRAALIGGAGETVSNNRKSIRENQAQLGANDKLKGLGTVSDEARLSIANDPEKAQQFLALWRNAKNGVEGADKKVKQFIKSEELAVAKAKELAKALEPPQSDSEIYSDATNAITDALDHEIMLIENRNALLFEQQNGQTPEALEQAIESRNAEITVLEHLVKQVESLNDADEDRVAALNRQKEMIQRQIDALDRANEMDQRRIDALQREDELRNRAADLINRDLELLSRQEDAVRNAYQARIDALDEIAKINDHILQSQQSQLNIGKALSEGDVYAAAQAAAEMQANQVQFAGQQNRDGLEQGMENAVNGLTTANGMTRAQADAQLQAIKDQSYQTSLQIRDIEDQIYARNQQMIPLKDQQYALDLQSQAIQDAILARNTSTRDVYQQQIDALVLKNEQEQFLLDKLDLTNQKETEAMEAKRDALEREIDLQNSSFLQVSNIRDMTEKAKDKAIELANYWGGVASNAWNAAAAIEAAAGANAVPTKKYSGGMIQKYAAGAVVGDGARDSVSAMLTPGEFVVRKAMVDKYGTAMFQKINQGAFSVPKYSAGSGSVSMPDGAGGSQSTNISAPVYNSYSVNVSASTNASPDDIARTVIAKIKTIESSNIRRINGY